MQPTTTTFTKTIIFRKSFVGCVRHRASLIVLISVIILPFLDVLLYRDNLQEALIIVFFILPIYICTLACILFFRAKYILTESTITRHYFSINLKKITSEINLSKIATIELYQMTLLNDKNKVIHSFVSEHDNTTGNVHNDHRIRDYFGVFLLTDNQSNTFVFDPLELDYDTAVNCMLHILSETQGINKNSDDYSVAKRFSEHKITFSELEKKSIEIATKKYQKSVQLKNKEDRDRILYSVLIFGVLVTYYLLR